VAVTPLVPLTLRGRQKGCSARPRLSRGCSVKSALQPRARPAWGDPQGSSRSYRDSGGVYLRLGRGQAPPYAEGNRATLKGRTTLWAGTRPAPTSPVVARFIGPQKWAGTSPAPTRGEMARPRSADFIPTKPGERAGASHHSNFF